MRSSPLSCRLLAPGLVALLTLLAGAQEPPRLGPGLAQVDDLPGAAAVALDAQGRIYVALTEGHAVAVLAPDGALTARWGSRGVDRGQLDGPAGLALAPGGELFVSETGNHRVQRFTREGRWLAAFGSLGSGPGQLRRPGGLHVADGRLVVADTGNHRVAVFDLDGELLELFGGHGGAASELRSPADVAVDERGTLCIADTGNDRLVLRHADGRWETWGDRGPQPGLFLAPSALAWAGGRLYVADRDNHRVTVFDRSGRRLYEWGLHALRPREGRGALHYPDGLAVLARPGPGGLLAVLAESIEDRVQLVAPATEEPGVYAADPSLRSGVSPHFGPPAAAAGSLLALVEPETRSVLVHDLRRTRPILVHRLGGPGTAAGRFLDVTDVALSPDGSRLYAADRAARRVSCFQLVHDPAAPLAFDPTLSRLVWSLDLPARLGRPVEPVALATDAAGRLYLADALAAAVLVLGTDLRPVRTLGPAHGEAGLRLSSPVDLALSPDGELLYVADEHAGRVLAWRTSGAVATDWGPAGRGPDDLQRPSGVAVAADGSVTIVDRGAHQVARYDPSGRPLGGWGGRGLGAGEFFKPRGAAFDARGDLHVVDHGNHRLQVFRDGRFLDALGPRLYVAPTRPGTLPAVDRQEHRGRPPDEEGP